MRLIDHLSKEQLDKLNRIGNTKPNPIKRKKPKQNYSESELHELMGVNRDTYKRGKGGAYKSNKK